MKRRLFNLLAGVSLLLCVTTTLLWVRGYSGEQFVRLSRHKGYTADVYGGQLRLSVETQSIMRFDTEVGEVDLSPTWTWVFERNKQGGWVAVDIPCLCITISSGKFVSRAISVAPSVIVAATNFPGYLSDRIRCPYEPWSPDINRADRS